MSSISTSSTGLRRIEIVVRGKRHKIRLGRMPVTAVQKLKVRIDALNEARALGGRDADAEKWCDRLGFDLREKLMLIGLLPRRAEETLRGLVDRFNGGRSHVKASTRAADKQATDSLLKWFGDNKLIHAITPTDAQDWADDLAAEEPDKKKLAPATIAKRIIKARSVFARAVKPWKLLESNPLDGLHVGSQKNDARLAFINAEMSTSVLDSCPDAEWRAIFVLARWGGVRVPSEIAEMQWADIVWDKHRFRVRSPKTAHHEGGSERWTPLFPEVEKSLTTLLEASEPGAVYVFSEKRRKASNLRTNLMKIIRRAGLTPWPRLFQNLRSSRETELIEVYPEPLVCRWLGNSPKVARKHYLQMLDIYFEMAAQNAAQQTGATERTDNAESGKSDENRDSDSEFVSLNGRYRANSLRDSLRKLLHSHGCGAKSGALANAVVEFLKKPTEAPAR